jgi:hypothetical protein
MYTNGTNENGFSLGLGTSLYKWKSRCYF